MSISRVGLRVLLNKVVALKNASRKNEKLISAINRIVLRGFDDLRKGLMCRWPEIVRGSVAGIVARP